MFYPQNFPVVVPVAKAFITMAGDGSYRLQMGINLKNRGLASAEDIAILFVPLDQHCQTFYTPTDGAWTSEVMAFILEAIRQFTR